MARFTWKSLEVVVREVDRATAIDISRRVIAFVADTELDKLAFAEFVTNLIGSRSPIVILKDGQPLPDGVHTIDDDILMLPITEANFSKQPASLAGEIVNTAEVVNHWLISSFFSAALRGTNTTPPNATTSASTA